jgi:hypothetical protein
MMEKAERFSPSASRKHKAKADADYAEALSAGNSDRGKTDRAVADSLPIPPEPTDTAGPPDGAPGAGQADDAPDRGGR